MNTKRSPSVFFELTLRNDSIALLLSKYTGRFLDNVDIWEGMILESIEVWIMEGEGYYWTKHTSSIPLGLLGTAILSW